MQNREADAPSPDGDSSSSLLDAQETSPTTSIEEDDLANDPLAVQSTQQLIAHRRHRGCRERLVRVLYNANDTTLRRRANRLAACCQCPTFYSNSNTPLGCRLARCRDRLCPLCSKRRGLQATAKLAAITQTFNSPRLITLTMRSSPDDLASRVRKLFHDFGRLRLLAGWKDRVIGGVWTLEVTRNNTAGHWHAHLHIIADGGFFPQPVLKKLWHETTGDSFIVDVRAIHDRAEAARYVAAYLAKPMDLETWSNAQIIEYATALHGKRLMQPFGTARKVELDEDHEPPEPGTFAELCSAHTLFAATRSDYEPALRARDIIARISMDHAIAAGVQHPLPPSMQPPVTPDEIAFAIQTLRRLQESYPNLPDEEPAASPLVTTEPPPDPQLDFPADRNTHR